MSGVTSAGRTVSDGAGRKKLTVVIVNYNVKYYVEQCLRSLLKAMCGIDGEVYVVDNHSRDGSVEYLKPLFPDVTFIAGSHNQGFARGNNIAIRQTDSDYVLLLNPDTIVGESVISDCLDFMDGHAEAGGLGVCMRKSSGKRAMESRRGLPTPMTSFYKMCGLCARYPASRRFGKYYMSYLPWDEAARIEVVSGAFFMLRRRALDQAGLLDEDYFMYGEDIDLSYRLIKAGYDNWYLPCDILHYKGESTEKTSFRYVHVFYQAMLVFCRKHYGHLRPWITLPVQAAIYVKATAALFGMMTERVRKSLGFTVRRKEQSATYVFIGSAAAISACRRIARENGLVSTFIEGDEHTMPRGHAAIEGLGGGDTLTYVVYDTAAYSYGKMLSFFAANPSDTVLLGTYHGESGIVITGNDVFRQA